MPPGVWGLVKSVLFHTLHLGITLLLTLLFTLFNSNLGPAALGTHQLLLSIVELTYLQLINFTSVADPDPDPSIIKQK